MSRSRGDFYDCLTARQDALFELTDALLCTDGPVRTLVDPALAPEHRRGHGALYGSLNKGRLNVDRLRRTLAGLPLPRAADGRLVLAVDVSPWLRPDGADQRGAGSFWIVNWFAVPPRIRGDHPRDEAVQARYLGELIDQYDAERVHGCFVFTFAMPDFPCHEDPRLDLDKAGFGIVAVTGDGACRPKEAFHEVARRYGDTAVEE
ncbi:transposase [Streptomyces montanus]|uniref:Transposase n=1 Tax=Streptomyces montanus TaxID=2580423 RepID=A0A5R9FII3_9ACTN|nr:transposase [Streptomyces montanus]